MEFIKLLISYLDLTVILFRHFLRKCKIQLGRDVIINIGGVVKYLFQMNIRYSRILKEIRFGNLMMYFSECCPPPAEKDRGSHVRVTLLVPHRQGQRNLVAQVPVSTVYFPLLQFR